MMEEKNRANLRRLLHGLGQNQSIVIRFSDMETEPAAEANTSQLHIALQDMMPGKTLLVRFTHDNE